MNELADLEAKYREELRSHGLDFDKTTPDQALVALGLSFDDTWYQGMNRWDYLAAFFSGVLGGIAANIGKDEKGNLTFNSKDSFLNTKLKEFHDKVTQVTYEPENRLIRNIFAHGGDNIDRVPDIVYTENMPLPMHRLFSGHDLLQFSGDNVLLQMYKQYGLLGPLKMIVHFFYDSCSAIGLPLPGTSNFGETIYKEWCGRSVDIYREYFTLKASDFISEGITMALLKAYRVLDTKYWTHRVHSKQMPLYNKINIAAHSINLGTNLLCGTFNHPAAVALTKNAFQYQLKSWKKTNTIGVEVDKIASRIDRFQPDNRPIEQRILDMNMEFDKLT